MATIFGSAASAAGLISLAVQALDSAAKLKRCYESFKNAPREVKHLVAELELTQELLALLNTSAVPQGQQSQTSSQDPILVKCAKLCNDIRKDLESVLNPLQAQLATKPTRGAARFVLAEGRIKEWLVKLERAKSMLVVVLIKTNDFRTSSQLQSIQAGVSSISSSQQIINQQMSHVMSTSYCRNDALAQGRTAIDEWKSHTRASNAIFQSQSSDTQEKVRDVSLELSRLAHLIDAGKLERKAILSRVDGLNQRILDLSNLPEGKTIYQTQHQSKFRWFFIEYTSSTSKFVNESRNVDLQRSEKHHRNTFVVRLKLVMPTWLFNCHLVLVLRRSTSGWTRCFRSYKTLPDDSTALEACIKGNVGSISNLLIAGKLSLYDESVHGLNMLQVAAYSHQKALCHFLIQQGLESRRSDSVEDSALYQMLYVNPEGIPSMDQSIELFKYLQRHDDIEQHELDSEVAQLFSSYPDWSHSGHLVFLIKLYSAATIIHVRDPDDPSEDDLAEAFNRDLTRWGDDAVMLSLGVTRLGRSSSALQLAARRFAYTAFADTELDQGSVHGWRQICLKAILAGSALHGDFENELDWGSPFGVAIETIMNTLWAYNVEQYVQYKVVSKFFKSWIGLLNDAGITISKYIMRESQLLKSVRSRLVDEVSEEPSPISLHDAWVNWLLSGVRFKPIRRSPQWRLQWPANKVSRNKPGECENDIEAELFQTNKQVPGAWTPYGEAAYQEESSGHLHGNMFDDSQPNNSESSRTKITHKLKFSCKSALFDTSTQSQAYRKLRFGKPDTSLWPPSGGGIPYDHEAGCKCRRCLQDKDRKKQARQKTRDLLRQAQGFVDTNQMTYGGGGGGGGGGLHACGGPVPRDHGER